MARRTGWRSMPRKTLPPLAGGAALLVVALTVVAITVQAEGEPFAANAGDDRTVECTGSAGAIVPLDGSRSTPGENETISQYDWYEGWNTSAQRHLGSGVALNVTLPLGEHDVTLRVQNATNHTRFDNVTIRIVDTTAPTITALSPTATLWPPNHKMRSVHADVSASDACSSVSWVMESATSDEPDDAQGDGHATGDVQGAQAGAADEDVLLRSERAGPGDGRAYTLVYKATDGAGNVARATVSVLVPHDQG